MGMAGHRLITVTSGLAGLALGFLGAVALAGDATPGVEAPPVPPTSGEFIRRADGSIFKFAVPRVHKPPKYPSRMVDMGGEGWVVISFVVQRDGTVRDPVVIDSSRRDFERAALEAARQFTYDPAELDGEPVEQVVPMYRFTFMLDPQSDSARQDFRRRFLQFEQQIARGDLDRAAVALANMESVGRLNLYEDAFYWWAKAIFHGAKGEHRQRRESLLRAIAYAGKNDRGGLAAPLHIQALAYLYGEYIRTGELAAALKTYEELVARVGDGKESPEIRVHVESVRAMLAGQGPLQAEGYLEDDRAWPHTLSRGGFEFIDISGQLHRFFLWCEQRTVELKIDPASSWQVPPSWGACQIYVRGEPGTQFTLVEYSLEDQGP
jgi:TonB family protein